MGTIWDGKGRPPDNFLLRHQELAEAEAWAEKHAEAMNDLDRAFLQACRDHRTRGEEKRNREKATRYRRIVILGGLVALLLIVTLSGLVAWALRNKQDAEQNAADARRKGRRAERGLTVI